MMIQQMHKDVMFTLARINRAGALLTAAGAALVLLLGASAAADVPTSQPAANQQTTSLISQGLNNGQGIKLFVGKSVVLTTNADYKRVNIGQVDVADVNPIAPRTVLVTAKKAGETQLMIWDNNEHVQVVDVEVDVDLQAVKQQLKVSFPDLNIELAVMADSLALRGQVPSAQVAEQVVELVSAYAKVHNFLEISGGQQIILHVQVAEVSKSIERDLGVNFGGTNGVSIFGNNAGAFNPFSLTGGPPAILGVPSGGGVGSLFGTGAAGDTAFQIFLKALRENNLMRTLAEPNVVCISGQQATFLAGGSIPIPVSQGTLGISVQQQPYGVTLNFTPLMLGNGKIRLKVDPEVSALDYGNAITIPGSGPIPALTSQKVNTTVELADGQSIALAGMFEDNVNATVDAIPLLGDIPILGELFRSTKYQRNETELVIIVTPHLAGAMNPDQVPLLPGQHWRYPTATQLYLGMDMGGPVVESAPGLTDKNSKRPAGPPPQFHGAYGFTPAGASGPTPLQ